MTDSPRMAKILAAERAVVEKGGLVLRLAGAFWTAPASVYMCMCVGGATRLPIAHLKRTTDHQTTH